MPDASRTLISRAALAACFTLVTVIRAAAQIPQPVFTPAPAAPEFLPRYEFHLTTYKLTGIEDVEERFDWDAHFGGSVDLVDYMVGRAALAVDYEAVMGHEQRPFDPNQATYTLESSLSARAGSVELAAVFHHVSRHLSDRPKSFAVAWNTIGARLLQENRVGNTSISVDVDFAKVIQESFVDYTWVGELGLQVQQPVSDRVGVFANGRGQLFTTNGVTVDRGPQFGFIAQAGVRVRGGAGALEMFAGFERRVDAYPLERTPRQWGLAGFRLVSR